MKISETHVSEIYTIQDSINLINVYGKLFNKEKEAQLMQQVLEQKMKEFIFFANNKPTLNVAYFIWKNPWMVAASNTYINHLLALNKYTNYYENLMRYPEVLINEIDSAKIDAIFLSSEPFPFSEKHISEFKNKLPNTKVILVDGEMFSWHGSRLIKAFDYFIKLRNSI